MKPKYNIGKIVYYIFNNEIRKVIIKKITITDNMVIYNDTILESSIYTIESTAYNALVKKMKSYIKKIDKT